MLDWEQFLTLQEQEFGKETIDRWLRSLLTLRFDACNLYLEAKDSFQALWFEEHIRHKLAGFVNCNQKPIAVHLQVAGVKKESPRKKSGVTKEQQRAGVAPSSLFFEELDPSCSFDEFYGSEDNEITYKVLDEVCTKLISGKLQVMSSFSETASLPTVNNSLNPIYLYGPPGSGKTHLLMAVAQKLKRVGYNTVYARAELFCDHVVKSIRSGEMAHFRALYRTADILLIDDVHCLAKKNATQEEFFNTFNALHIAGKQIILAANTTPQSLSFIEARLISRFEWGIVLPLSPPQKKDLAKLIEKKAAFFQFPLGGRTAQFLADTFATNPKSALRALDALMLRSHLNQKGERAQKIGLPLASVKTLLSDLIENEKTNSLSAERIISQVAEYYGVRIDDINGKSQSREYVVPRQVAMYLCRTLLKIPYMRIGDLFSRDHSTVMSACRQIQKQMSLIESDMASACNSIQLKLQNIST